MRTQFKRIHRESGFTILETVLVLSLLTILLVQSIPHQQRQQSEKREAYAVRGLNAVAQAAIAHYVDEDQAWYRTWPADVSTLAARGYLPVFNDRNGFGGNYEICPGGCVSGMTIATSVETAAHALAVQALWGPTANVSGVTITVGIPVPGQESSHLALLDLAGTREITGTVEFGTGANLDLQLNNILDGNLIEANEVNAINDAGTGLVDADTVNGSSVSAEEFYYRSTE